MLEQMNKLRPLFSRRDKVKYAVLFVLMGIGALLEVAGVGAVPAFVATLAVPDQIRSYPYADQVLDTLGIITDVELVVWGAVALVVVYALRAAYLIMLSYLQIRMTEHHRVRFSRMLFKQYLEAPYEFHLGRNTAELLRNVNGETKNIITGVINPLLTLALNVMMTIGIMALLISRTPWVALVAIAMVGGGGWLFLRVVREKMHRVGKQARTERKKSIQAVNQGLGGFQDARVLGVEPFFAKDFHDSIARYAEHQRYHQFIKKLSNPLLEFIALAGLMLVVITMALMGTDLQAMIPLLGLFGAAIVRLRSSMGAITGNINTLRYNMASVDAVVGDMQLLRNMSGQDLRIRRKRGSRAPILPLRHAIELEHVSYTYPNTEVPAIKDISLAIARGESVGFVGATGSGKTTLINVLLGLLKPQEGLITVDGEDVYTNMRGWQNNIGYIPQSIYLLDDSIRRNIAFGLPEADIDDAQLWTAIRAAQLEEYVLDLPDGVETHVGERGVRLSGGQRQRVGLARALYHNPDVLIMDEATSALDNETESHVMQALEALKGDRTMVTIAHRLSTVRNCDRLYFLEDGHIEARGTYEELCAIHGGFRRMAEVA